MFTSQTTLLFSLFEEKHSLFTQKIVILSKEDKSCLILPNGNSIPLCGFILKDKSCLILPNASTKEP